MLIKIAWRNLWRNKKRSIITMTSIAIAVMLAVFMRAMQLGMYENMIHNVVGSYVGYAQIHGKGYWDEQSLDNAMKITPEMREKILSVPGVKNILQRIQSFSLGSRKDHTKGVYIAGIEMDEERNMVDWGKRLTGGQLLQKGKNEVMIAKDVAKVFKAEVGDTMIFIGQGYHGMSAAGKYRIAGIVDMKNPKLNSLSVFMPLQTAREYLSAEGIITHLIIDKTPRADERRLVASLRSTLDTSKYEVMGWREMLPELEQAILADNVGGLLMVFILYMIITFGIFGTVLMMTQERIFELGLLIAIGMSRIKLIITLVYETFILSILGLLAGLAIIMPIVYYYHLHPLLLDANQKEAVEKFGFEAKIPFMFDTGIPLTHALIIFSISMVIVLYPAIRIWRLNPVDAMRNK